MVFVQGIISDWLMDRIHGRDELKYGQEKFGELLQAIHGTLRILLLCVDSWDFQLMARDNCTIIIIIIMHTSVFL